MIKILKMHPSYNGAQTANLMRRLLEDAARFMRRDVSKAVESAPEWEKFDGPHFDRFNFRLREQSAWRVILRRVQYPATEEGRQRWRLRSQ